MARHISCGISLLLAAALAGCGQPWDDNGPADSLGIEFPTIAENPHAAPLGAVVFFIDGVRSDWFEQMLDAGELPAFKALADRGLYAPRAVVGLPSITLPGVISFLTARHPGHHGITGVAWFDRVQLVYRNYEDTAQMPQANRDYTSADIFEALGRGTTCTMMLQSDRGASAVYGEWTGVPAIAYHLGRYEFVDRITMQHWHELARVARDRGDFPTLTVVYIGAPDFVAHFEGIETGRYRDAIRHADRQIGRVLGDLKRAGLLDRLLIGIFSDHGHQQTPHHIPLARWLRNDIGLNVAEKELNGDAEELGHRAKYYDGFSAVVVVSGDRYAALHLRRPIRDAAGRATDFAPWPQSPDPSELAAYPTVDGQVDLPGLLLSQEAVDAIAWPAGENRVRVRRRGGEVEFAATGEGISCRVISGNDPLEWKGKVATDLLAGKPADGRRWLAETLDTDYPDLPEQMLAYFRTHRAGDLAVFAAPGWDFHEPYGAGHGGLGPVDMFAPMLLAGPGVPHGRLKTARMIDLPATLLPLLGAKVPPDADGLPLTQASHLLRR